ERTRRTLSPASVGRSTRARRADMPFLLLERVSDPFDAARGDRSPSAAAAISSETWFLLPNRALGRIQEMGESRGSHGLASRLTGGGSMRRNRRLNCFFIVGSILLLMTVLCGSAVAEGRVVSVRATADRPTYQGTCPVRITVTGIVVTDAPVAKLVVEFRHANGYRSPA